MKRLTALLLTAFLLLSACAAPTTGPQAGSSSPTLKKLALKEPTYPAFPEMPSYEDGSKDYYNAQQNYYKALIEFRGDGISEETADLLNRFAARSTPPVLKGMEGKNLIYSPLSLWSALALLARCAEGESRQQVLDALGADSVEQLRTLVPELWQGLYTRDGKNTLIPANSVWLNDSMKGSSVQETLDSLAADYYAGSYCVPMGTAKADSAVSEWVSEQTGGLIGGGAPVVQTESDTLALLVSSLYYKAAWYNEFPEPLTEPRTFTAADGSENMVDFMINQSDRSPFLMREGYQAAALPTHMGQMLFVLPDAGVTPESLLADPNFLSNLSLTAEDACEGLVKWYVPKFDVESSLDLMDTLRSMGITEVLDAQTADLSALTSLNAFLGGASQMGRVKVDEQGVEAAAVTILEAPASAPPEISPKECIMDLNRPFLFVIKAENVPLFIGVVNQVEK